MFGESHLIDHLFHFTAGEREKLTVSEPVTQQRAVNNGVTDNNGL